ncbi:PucR family transcriptional regulator [Actinocorallia lasiicapitis]
MEGASRDNDAAVRAEYLRIAQRIYENAVALSEQIADAMCREIPAFAGVPEDFLKEVRDTLTMGATRASTASIEDRRLTRHDVVFSPRTFAAKIAQRGISLEAYQHGFRITQRVYWNAIAEYAEPSPAGDRAVIQLTSQLVRFTHMLSDAAAQGYLEYQRSAITEDDRHRRDLVETLLAGRPVTGRPLTELARAHGIGPGASVAVIVAVGAGAPAPAGEDLYLTSAALGGVGVTDQRPLVAARHEEIVVFAAVRAGSDPRRLSDALTSVQAELAGQGVRLAIGMSTITEGTSELPRAYAEARLALELSGPEGGVTALPLLSPFRYLALRADPTAWHLVDPAVRELLHSDRQRGGTLTATIRAFADADLNLRHAAAELNVHHNTAQYRLQRIQERTGHNPRHIADLVELLTAIALHETHR